MFGIVVVVITSWLFVRWYAEGANAWMPAVISYSNPRTLTAIAYVVAAVMMSLLLVNVLWLQTYLGLIGHPAGVLAIFVIPILGEQLTGPIAVVFSILMFAVLWAYPIAGANWPSQSSTSPSCPTLEGPATGNRQYSRPHIRVTTPITIGLLIAVIAIPVVLALWLHARHQLPIEQQQKNEWLSRVHGGIWQLNGLFATAAGCIAYARATSLRVPQALLAAAVTTVIGVLLAIIIFVIDACGGFAVATRSCAGSDIAGIAKDLGPLVFRMGSYISLIGILAFAAAFAAYRWVRMRFATTEVDY